MIYGIGTDIVDIARIRQVMERTSGRFAERVLGKQELEEYQARSARCTKRGMAFLATRFAVKEAFSKAVGLGVKPPVALKLLQTLNDPATGQPHIVTTGALASWLDKQCIRTHVSLSDEREVVVAFVIAEVS